MVAIVVFTPLQNFPYAVLPKAALGGNGFIIVRAGHVEFCKRGYLPMNFSNSSPFPALVEPCGAIPRGVATNLYAGCGWH